MESFGQCLLSIVILGQVLNISYISFISSIKCVFLIWMFFVLGEIILLVCGLPSVCMLLCFTLIGYCLHKFLNLFGVAQEIVSEGRYVQFVVEFEYIRYGSR